MSRGTHKLMREPQTSSGSAQGYTGLGFMLNLFHCCEIRDVCVFACVWCRTLRALKSCVLVFNKSHESRLVQSGRIFEKT